MSKFGIKSISYIPLCSTEEIKLEMKKPTGNEIVKKMWDKLDDEEQGFINVMIDRDNKQNEEIERLNNIINKLEKYLIEQVERSYSNDYDNVLDKLDELKGNNNGVWVNNLLEVIKENNIEFGSDKE